VAMGLLLGVRMTISFCADRHVERTFGQLMEAVVRTEIVWSDPRSDDEAARIEAARLETLSMDVMHHVCAAMPGLTKYVRANGTERTLAREAYLSVLGVLAMTTRICEREAVPAIAIENVQEAAQGLLDALVPYVTGAETGLRLALLERRREQVCCPQ
jgi:hypothetical protein